MVIAGSIAAGVAGERYGETRRGFVAGAQTVAVVDENALIVLRVRSVFMTCQKYA